ncbi:MAG TPA: class I SAM-dependent methyltransferase [Jatrophihabitans sp.]|nr:class I SAM-dependent methyltransferase [Jatrophihabitans sp.]
MVDSEWQWDPSLYAGSAQHYVRGRVAYPPELADALVAALELDGSGRLLDVGCGPGSLTLQLAASFERATGLDADAEMLAEAARQARAAGITNVDWLHLRAEDISPALGRFRVVTLAQSFHWMDRPRVAPLVREVLDPNGALVHVHATTHDGTETDLLLPHPQPPRREINALVERFLGSRRRAGQGVRPAAASGVAETGREEAEIYGAAGFRDPSRIEIPERTVTRSADDVVAGVFSLSSAAPHLFGARAAEFEAALRELLTRTSVDGRFSARMREIAIDIWRV